MNNFSIKPLLQSRYPLAVIAGLLLAASFPKIGIAGFAWIAPGLILFAALGKRGADAFRIGYVAGLAWYLTSLYWLLFIPYRWHSIPIGPTAGWLALCGYLALYPATWVWLALRLSPFDSGLPDSGTVTGDCLALARQIADWGWSRRTLWAVSCAALWVALEMVLARLLGGFPWDLLGVSQHDILPLIQLASVTGIYGISFIVVWTSVSLLCAALVILGRPNLRSPWTGEILLPFVALVASFIFGFHRLRTTPAPARTLIATLVQPSIPQTLIWNPEKDDERFRGLLRLSEKALAHKTELLIWPEAAIPKLLRYDEETFQAVTSLARKHHVWMIVGSDDAERAPDNADPNRVEYFNSSFLISPSGQLMTRYNKRHLVMFGEYIPLVRWLPFIKWFTPIQGSFTAGKRSVPFDFTLPQESPPAAGRNSGAATPGAGSEAGAALKGAWPVRTAVLICFEDVFPQLAREDARPDTDFLVNITNDGWFGESAAQWQHAASAQFRSVENGLPLVRCTNTGLTCWFDSRGRLREWFTDASGTIYGRGFMTAQIPLLAPGARRPPTFYNQHGDWFGWSCMAFSGALVLGQITRRRATGHQLQSGDNSQG